MATTDLLWLTADETINLSELARVSGLDTTELIELVEYGALTPQTAAAHAESQSVQTEPVPKSQPVQSQSTSSEIIFSASWVTPLRKAAQLRRDYDLDIFVMVLLLDHLNQIESLETQLLTLRARGV